MSTIQVGDLMRISVALINQIHDMPNQTSILIRLKEVRIEEDGSKTLVMERAELEGERES